MATLVMFSELCGVTWDGDGILDEKPFEGGGGEGRSWIPTGAIKQ